MRRLVLGLSVVAVLGPAVALAQTAPPAAPSATNPAPKRGGDITRDEYIQRAVDRARHAAETRFDRMDTDHDGVLTMEERRAARAARRGSASQ